MRVLNRCMLGVTILLLVCEVVISQLCMSLITLVDGFHTLYVLVRMALPPPARTQKAQHRPAASPRCGGSSSSRRPSTSSAGLSRPHCHTWVHSPCSQSSSFFISSSPPPPPPALHCGPSYSSTRIQTVGFFISALLLTSLCIAYCMEILSHILQPQPVQRPLLTVVVGAFSLLQKMLMLGLSLGQQTGNTETKSDLEMSSKVWAEDEAECQAEQERVLEIQSTVDGSLHNGSLIIWNPESSRVHDRDPQTPDPQPGVHLRTAAAQTDSARTSSDRWDCEAASRVSDLKTCTCGPQSDWFTEKSKDNIYMGCLESQSTPEIFVSSCPTESPGCLRSLVAVAQNLWSSVLAVIGSLVMLLIRPGCCGLLVYLDPGLSLLSVAVLLATALPQLHRYGLILMQATPPHICVSDLGRRIASVPDVQAVHELHVWQLTESCTVTSVHVRCHAGFLANRCADVMSGVTEVLQNAGVSCCTVQPEFPVSSVAAGDLDVSAQVVHREALSLPPVLACSLSCGKACCGKMCCSAPAEECRDPPEAPAGETDRDAGHRKTFF